MLSGGNTEKGQSVTENDTSLPRLGDIAVAVSLLTRLPLRLPDAAYARGARAAWAYPLVGVVLGGLATLIGLALLPVGSGIAALGVLATTVILSGAMHEDGLADCADGFWGGWEKARRLEIMKDSQIGTYGVIALILSFAARWWALDQIFALDPAARSPILGALVATGVLSRAGMPVLMAWLPNARHTGLSQSVGRPNWVTATMAVLLAVAIGTAVLGQDALIGAAVLSGVVAAAGLIARAKIGGQTGDVLGASQQLGEIALLVTLAALWA